MNPPRQLNPITGFGEIVSDLGNDEVDQLTLGVPTRFEDQTLVTALQSEGGATSVL